MKQINTHVSEEKSPTTFFSLWFNQEGVSNYQCSLLTQFFIALFGGGRHSIRKSNSQHLQRSAAFAK